MTREAAQAPVPVLFACESFVVVDKPSGLLAVPGRGPEGADCVLARLRAALPAGAEPRSCHRLDMDTSGLMVIALNADAHRHVSRQFEVRAVAKEYEAVLTGEVRAHSGVIELWHRVDLDDRPRQIEDPVYGKQALTEWRLMNTAQGRSRVELVPLTGRTHQLRFAAAHPNGLGSPICGDRLYGDAATASRLLLHARRISFVHPVSGEQLTFYSPTPF